MKSNDNIIWPEGGILCIMNTNHNDSFYMNNKSASVDCFFGEKVPSLTCKHLHVEMSDKQLSTLTYHLINLCAQQEIAIKNYGDIFEHAKRSNN